MPGTMKDLLHFLDLIAHLGRTLEPMMRQYGTTIYVVVFLFIATIEGRCALRLRGAMYDARTSEQP